MPFPWLAAATAASAASSAFGSYQSSKGQSEANDTNVMLAREQMAFQERMDNTKYQRGVEDARKAGFNPLVAFPGSGHAPMGATATVQNERPNRGELYLSTAKGLADIMLTREMVKTEKSKQELNRAEANAKGGSLGVPGLFNVPLRTVGNFFTANPSTAASAKVAHKKAESFKQSNPKAYNAWLGKS